MKLFIPFGAIVGLASMILATPLPEPVPAPALAPGEADLAARGDNWAYCNWGTENYDESTGTSVASIYIKAGGPFVGSGPITTNIGLINLLNQILNQCGQGYIDGPFIISGGGPYMVHYRLSSGFPDKCTENAIWLATEPTGAYWGLECQWKVDPTQF